jgi:hypothetical protein
LRPVVKDDLELAILDVRRGLVLGHESDADALARGDEHLVDAVDDHLSFHAHLDLAARLLELPRVDAAGQSRIDAAMTREVLRLLRRCVFRELARRGRRDQPYRRADRDCDVVRMFRIGVWPDYFPGVQFSRDPEALDQYSRAMTPNTGPYDAEVNARAVAALFNKIGPAILVTHSQSGGPGWLTVMKSPSVRAVVSYEPGSGFVFPEGEVPAPMPSLTGPLEGVAVPGEQFMALTKVPIVLYSWLPRWRS